jgi:UDP-2,3-diacylglucosamine pyrophosphatase LpxH
MSVIEETIHPGTVLRPYPHPFPNLWQKLIHRRLNTVFGRAPYVLFDNDSRFIFFSDVHRGDRSRADAFAPNEPIYCHALNHYFAEGFTYVEVGDGDELWQHHDFNRIRQAHGRIFDLLHRFAALDRIHIILGNHDLPDGRFHPQAKDDIPTIDGLLLRHRRTGRQIFVVHGHQADFISERFYFMSRFTVRHFWRRFLLWGLVKPEPKPDPSVQRSLIQQRGVEWILLQQKKVAQRIAQWSQLNRQMVICGHTHLPVGAASRFTPYFNTGSCVNPGYITGIEIQQGNIMLVKWLVENGRFTRQVIHSSPL